MITRTQKQPSQQKLADLLKQMMERQGFAKLIFDSVPAAHASFRQYDEAIAKIIKRKRGERGKLAGGVLTEEIAVDLLKSRKDQLKRDGVDTEDAWKKARQEVAKVFGVKPATLEDWYRGVPKRERRKQLAERKNQKYNGKRQSRD